MSEDGAIKVPKLTGSNNYELQAIRVKAALIAKDLFNFHKQSAELNAKGLKDDAKALSYIQLACADGPLLHISALDKPSDTQDHLSRLYTPRGFSSEFILFKEFFGATLSSLGTVENFLATIKRVSTSLKAKDLELPDKLVIAWTLHNLGPEYEAFITSTTQSYRAESTALNQDDLFANLMDESRRLQDIDENALVARGYKKSAAKCDECGRTGHKKETYYKLHPELRPRRGGNRADSASDASTDAQKSKTEETGVSDVLITTNQSALSVKHSTDNWILDSGATSHIYCDINFFDSIAPTSTRIAQGGATNLPARGIGSITVKLPNSARAVLESILYMPKLQLNLVSLSRLMQKGAKISFAKESADILLKSGAKLQATADSQELFYIPFSADYQLALVATTPKRTVLQHQRFDHIGATALSKIPNSVSGISKANASYAPANPCETYIKGKFAASPNHDAATTHYSEYGSHITSNLCGPISKTAFRGIKYLHTLLDTATKYLDFQLLKTKGEALRAFKTIKTAVENQSDKKIKILRTDQGKEFANTAFDTYLAECGILYEHSAPYAHKQNGAAERVNRTILEKARYLIFQCGLPTSYWPLVVEAAIYLYNRTWHSAISKTLFKARFGREPDVANIRLFGSIVFIKNDSSQKL